MQDYFLTGAQEVRFADEKNGQIHIADVFLKDTNTVIEFQHSPIAPDEFCSRTAFHLNNCRRNTLVKIAKNLAVSRSALYRLVHEYEEKHGSGDF